MLQGSRKLIAFVALLVAVVAIDYHAQPSSGETIEKLIYLFMGFLGANGYEWWQKGKDSGA